MFYPDSRDGRSVNVAMRDSFLCKVAQYEVRSPVDMLGFLFATICPDQLGLTGRPFSLKKGLPYKISEHDVKCGSH